MRASTGFSYIIYNFINKIDRKGIQYIRYKDVYKLN